MPNYEILHKFTIYNFLSHYESICFYDSWYRI